MNWVAVCPENHEVTVVEYDDLLTKKTLEETDNFEDFLTSKDHPTKMEVGERRGLQRSTLSSSTTPARD